MEIFINILLLGAGFALLIKGADLFVDGSSKIAAAAKIPPLIIGLTLVSIGTSAPEASVSIISALDGMSDMSIGNVVGSDIFNTLFILGVSSLIVPLAIGRDMKKFDIPIMVGVYILLLIFCFLITPYTLELWEAAVLLALFLCYTVFLILRAKKNPPPPVENEKPRPLALSIVFAVLGLGGIIFGGNLTVTGAAELARLLGMSESLVALTIVAVGTSLPELVTSAVASLKGENDIAVGNVVGSNIFNIILILGLSAAIHPLSVSANALVDMLVMLASGVLVAVVALFREKTNKPVGALFVLSYIAYLVFIIIRN